MEIDIMEQQKVVSSVSDYSGIMTMLRSKKRKLEVLKDCSDSEKDMKQGRLSSLPDCILSEILSHLPLKDAVATSVLSRPWRHLWIHITRLRLDTFKPEKNVSEYFRSYINCVDLILCRNTTSDIHSFYLDDLPCNTVSIRIFDDFKSKLNCWFQKLCDRNVVEIIVSVTSCTVPLPTCVLQSKSLACLKLSEDVRYEFPKDGVIGFPYLKKLSIGIHDRACDLQVIQPLLKSIPALEELDLFMDLGDLQKVQHVEISTPVLKSLTIRCRRFPQRSEIDIDSPKLEYFKIIGVSGTSIGSMASSLNIPTLPLPMCVFQSKSLANLQLSEHVCYKFPKEGGIYDFPYLKKLSIGIHDRDFDFVQPMLKSIPALEDLDLFINLGHDDLKKVQDVEISAPGLKSLTIRCIHFPQQNKIVIDSPKLEYLKIIGVSVRYHFVEKPTELRTAIISGYFSFPCISSVRAFRLNTPAFIPVFNNSTYGNDGVVLDAIYRNLTHLTIKGSHKTETNWNDQVPTSVLSKLKTVDVDLRAENGYKEAINLLRYVLSNSSDVLEQVIVYGPCGQGREREEMFCRALASLSPIISANCELEFRGSVITKRVN